MDGVEIAAAPTDVVGSPHDRIVRGTSIVLAAMPWFATGLLYLFAWHTSRTFGEWPTYANPDPKVANGALYLASGLAMLATLPSVGTLLIGLPAVRRLRMTRVDILLIALAIIGALVWVDVFAGALGDWYMD